MLEVIGAIVLTALAVLLPSTLLAAGPAAAAARLRWGLVVAAWFVVVAAAAAFGVFDAAAGGVPALGVAIGAPLVAAGVAFVRSAQFRALAYETPLPVLVSVHGGRLLGVLFLLLLTQGRLPPTFATAAGWGDIGVGAVALLFGWLLYRGTLRSRAPLWLWNGVGLADLVIAVTLGVGSAPGSSLRFIFEPTDGGTITSLPWILIPAFLVPLYLLTHVAIFMRLAREPAAGRRSPALA
ncbi:MAG TPA: hypothetical protein VFR86_26725 [Burkholderiaceae bacterium]|nr:hypothetical protein [Burkholderiaceae bacterium]